jgi:hypothetical protein
VISVAAPANAVIGSPWRSGPPNGWSSIRNLSRITTEKSPCAKFERRDFNDAIHCRPFYVDHIERSTRWRFSPTILRIVLAE